MVDEHDVSKLLSSAVLIGAGQVFYSVSQLLERIVVARLLTTDAYGEVSIGLAILTFVTTVGLLGMRGGVPRYMSRFDDEENERGVWLTGVVIAGVASLVLTAVLLGSAGILSDLLFERAGSNGLVTLFVACIPFTVGLELAVAGIRGRENTLYRTYARDLLYPTSRLLFLAGFLLAGLGVHAAAMAYLLGAIVSCALACYLLDRLVPLVGSARLRLRELLVFSVPLVFATVLSNMLTRTDTLMLGYFRPSREVGLYSAAYPLASGMLLVLSSFGFMYLPLASRLDSENERAEVGSIYELTTKWVYILTFPLFLTFVVFSSDVLTIVFGQRYATAGNALSILAIGFFTSAMFGRNRETLSALGYTTAIMGANGLAFLINVALNLVLIPRYGYMGAAMTSMFSFVVLNLTVYAILKLKYDITPFSKWSRRTFVVLPATLFPVAFLLRGSVSLTAVTLPLFLVGTGLCSIAIVSLAGCLQPADRIPISLLEQRLDVTVPFVHRYLPESN
ncbi:polysaccharide biosynthesis protein [Natrinema pellirubrum DSM 15624]|uniref:Membrane protein involved in the export of O-antigen and teichoic acid n=1 Tax=Natrinema pellirubrum (strain DSM 15624 / CIP 106293 / JCM 10476 / NCIMB 786 / 157) TaxID=797303 RepID=L0JK28_NATP1|nr:flippase [Natrinema pellirubrum]AGB31198.1 membrane protein involved in the export of O-antigen and teichoic acid [Natrinema pellirubrum DSM 15624]ELY81438.1 polysaccharide biosynthesis protein [Natrinema pellirubrum DSM 15624]